jgi:hypothetical protein
LLVVEGRIDHFVAKDAYGIRQAQAAYSASGGGFDGCGRLRGIAGPDGGLATGGWSNRDGENGSGGRPRHVPKISESDNVKRIVA